MFISHQAGRGLSEAPGDAHFLHPFIEHFPDRVDKIAQLVIRSRKGDRFKICPRTPLISRKGDRFKSVPVHL